MNKPIYLDFQATTPTDKRVIEAMIPWLSRPANPHASNHRWGNDASRAIDASRSQIAAAINGDARGLVFTSTATEAANIVLRSFAGPGRKMLVSSIEHPCVFDTIEFCASVGTTILSAPVGRDGVLDLDAFSDLLEGCDLASVMSVNNEVGTIQPIADIAALCTSEGVFFHTDAAQAIGRIPVDVSSGVSFLTLSGHKIYGPPGIGAIYADPDLLGVLKPLLSGGGQQDKLRPGTLPTALCVGLGEACALAIAEMEPDKFHASGLSQLFLKELSDHGLEFSINGSVDTRIAQNLNLSFWNTDAEEVLALLPDLAIATGSACSSGAIGPSRVLTAMGLEEGSIKSALRVGFGRQTTENEVVRAAAQMAAAIITSGGMQ